MDYQKSLMSEYVGKLVAVDLNEVDFSNSDFDWYGSFDEEKGVSTGEGQINLDYRDYLSTHADLFDDDDDEEDDYEDEEGDDLFDDDEDLFDDDDVDDEDYEYDERENWRLQTGVWFDINEDGLITRIEITAQVSSFGDSGLGDCDPEEEWTDDDLALAREFFDSITQ